MSSTSLHERELIGLQTPRVLSVPSAPTSAGPEAVRLAELAGLWSFPWQRLFCDGCLRQHADGRWAAFEVLLLVSRQNGKGTCIEIVELYALFMLGMNVYHTAHLMKTSRKAFKRLWTLIERTPQLRRRVLGKPKQTAEEIVVTLTNGARITFMARSGRAGRGLDDCDLLVLDEALFLDPKMVAATVPTMSTRADPEVGRFPLVIYASSAGVEGSVLLRALRQRGLDGDPTISLFDWSVDPEAATQPGFDPLAVEVVAQANPSLGALISMDYVRGEYGALTTTGSLQDYMRERLGVFDEGPETAGKAVPKAAWERRGGADGVPDGAVAFAVSAQFPDGDFGSIGAAGPQGDEHLGWLVDHRPGTSWLIDRLVGLVGEHSTCAVVIDPAGTAGQLLLDDLRSAFAERGLEHLLVEATMREVARAAGQFRFAVTGDPGDDPDAVPADEDGPALVRRQVRLRHYSSDQEPLDRAVAVAQRRNLAGAWTFDGRNGTTDISPVEAVSLALWGVTTRAPADYDVLESVY